MTPQFSIYLSAALGALWAAYEEGQKAGAVGIWIGLAIGLLVAVPHFLLSRMMGRWMLVKLERDKSAASAFRLMLAISFGLFFFAWWLSAPWSGDFLTRHALILVGRK